MTTNQVSEEQDALGELEELTEAECWALIGASSVGRIAVVVGHYPLVFPVNYALDGRHVVFQSNAGTKLWAIRHSNVTFQVDEFDAQRHAGWSVMIQGAAHELTPEYNAQLLGRAREAGAAPWAPGTRAHLVWVVADRISGRRITPATG